MDRQEELASLREKLAARQDRPGFTANVEALKKRIAELEAENGN